MDFKDFSQVLNEKHPTLLKSHAKKLYVASHFPQWEKMIEGTSGLRSSQRLRTVIEAVKFDVDKNNKLSNGLSKCIDDNLNESINSNKKIFDNAPKFKHILEFEDNISIKEQAKLYVLLYAFKSIKGFDYELNSGLNLQLTTKKELEKLIKEEPDYNNNVIENILSHFND